MWPAGLFQGSLCLIPTACKRTVHLFFSDHSEWSVPTVGRVNPFPTHHCSWGCPVGTGKKENKTLTAVAKKHEELSVSVDNWYKKRTGLSSSKQKYEGTGRSLHGEFPSHCSFPRHSWESMSTVRWCSANGQERTREQSGTHHLPLAF